MERPIYCQSPNIFTEQNMLRQFHSWKKGPNFNKNNCRPRVPGIQKESIYLKLWYKQIYISCFESSANRPSYSGSPDAILPSSNSNSFADSETSSEWRFAESCCLFFGTKERSLGKRDSPFQHGKMLPTSCGCFFGEKGNYSNCFWIDNISPPSYMFS